MYSSDTDDWGGPLRGTEQLILEAIGADTPEARGKLDGFYRTLHDIRNLPEPSIDGYWH